MDQNIVEYLRMAEQEKKRADDYYKKAEKLMNAIVTKEILGDYLSAANYHVGLANYYATRALIEEVDEKDKT